MIEILQNKANTEKIEFNAKDGDELLGSCSGVLDGDTFVLDSIECDDFFADGLVRAILNLMDLHGVKRARFDLPADKLALMRKLRFISGDSREMDSIADFFDKGCGGCH